MTRQHLLAQLQVYTAKSAIEQQHCDAVIRLLTTADNCFERSRTEGHLTASAWVILPEKQQVLLMHHTKLDRWLQPGGHADGDENLAGVALREAHEESGLCSLRLLSNEIFDVDVHTIPARKQEPEHLHFDIRYLVTADSSEQLNPDKRESKGFAWVPWYEAPALVKGEASITRMLNKTENLYSLTV